MGPLSKLSIGQVSVAIGALMAIAWIVVPGTVAVVVSVAGGALIALAAMANSNDEEADSASAD